MAGPSRARATATPARWATIRCWPPREHRRGAARPAADREGLDRPRDAPVRRRDDRSCPPRRATGELRFRADSGCWSAATIGRLRAHDVRCSITVRQTNPVQRAIAAIGEAAWTTIGSSPDGVAPVAETPVRGDRLVVRRVRNPGAQQQLFPTWRDHAFITDRVGSAVELDADHRRHALVELAIRDAKQGSGRNHHPPAGSSPTPPG